MIGFDQQSLAELFAQIPISADIETGLPETRINGITNDSRAVQPGFLFVAQEGGTTDGHQFIPQAIQNGAAAVIGTQDLQDVAVPYVRVQDSREALAYLSAAFYNFPARQLTMIGVTGTDGKTTTANLIYQILLAAGKRVGIISTINALIGNEILDTGLHVTTPEAPDIQRYLERMLSAGLTHVVLESTSHGLAQHRVTGCEFDIGVVTNITHEHLDFHGTYEAYRAAKGRLFTSLEKTHPKPQGNPRLAVLNRDDLSYDYLSHLVNGRQVAYSLTETGAGVWAEEIHHDLAGLHFTACGPDFRFTVDSPLLGDYNVSNCLAAIATTMVGLGVDHEAVRKGITALRSVPGRMERIDLKQDFLAIVDFAHTPNALRVTLEIARKMTRGKVIAVFGSAGLRDRQKRRMMAEVSAEIADIAVLTAEDPRTESLEDILAEMAEAARKKGGVENHTFFVVKDRGEAIRKAVNLAQENDLVIACGKGHEQSMCFGLVEYPWDERTAMTAAISERLGLKGPEMPYLPTQDFPMI
jgi:UDP-N-acetylmuramoyl-L-alanyl-D-glutamate--2,6-diaminopimelate ligase